MHVAIKQYNTLGALADANRKKLGIYGLEEKQRQLREERLSANEFVGSLPQGASVVKREAKDTPWRKANEPVDLSLTRMNKEQTHKYIMTGKKF